MCTLLRNINYDVAMRKTVTCLRSARNNAPIATDQVDSVKEVLKNLLITSAKLSNCEPLHIAEEITRIGKQLFLLIEVGIVLSPTITYSHIRSASSYETGCIT